MSTDTKALSMMDVLGCDIETATQYLEASNGDMDMAVSLFLEGATGSTRHPPPKTNATEGHDSMQPSPLSSPNGGNAWEMMDPSFPGEVIQSTQPDVSRDAELARRLAFELAENDAAEYPYVRAVPPFFESPFARNGGRGGNDGRGDGQGKRNTSPPVRGILPHTVRDSLSVSFDTVCVEAQRRNLWVLIFFHDTSVVGNIAQLSLWRNAGAEMLHEMCLCYDVDVHSPSGSELMQEYHLLNPFAHYACIIVHPVTQHKVVEVPLPSPEKSRGRGVLKNMNEEEVEDDELSEEILRDYSEDIISFVVGYIAEEGKPSSAGGGGEDGHDPAPPRSLPSPSFSSSSIEEATEKEGKSDVTFPLSSCTPSPPPPPITEWITSLEDFEVNDSEGTDKAFKLRFQFSKSTLDLRLRKNTPIRKILDYCAYRLHRENREVFPTIPKGVFLLVGFPPRRIDEVSLNQEEATLDSCAKIRNGDKIVVKV